LNWESKKILIRFETQEQNVTDLTLRNLSPLPSVLSRSYGKTQKHKRHRSTIREICLSLLSPTPKKFQPKSSFFSAQVGAERKKLKGGSPAPSSSAT
jgi:hypothetical protein